jgi:hypothetical protein
LKISKRLAKINIIQKMCKTFKKLIHLNCNHLKKNTFKNIATKIKKTGTKSHIPFKLPVAISCFINQIINRIIQAAKTFLEFNFFVKNNTTFDSKIQISATTKGKFENTKATETEKREIAIQNIV